MAGVLLQVPGSERKPSVRRSIGRRIAWATTAGCAVVIGGTTTAAVFANRAADQLQEQTIDGAIQDGLTLVEDNDGSIYSTSPETEVHIELGAGGCSAWVEVIEVKDDPNDSQRYVLDVGELQYDFTNFESMVAVLGENPCQPVSAPLG